MRNDVKLGLAVGGLLLGVVLAYALFFSNNSGGNREKELAAGNFGAVENNGAEASREQGAGTGAIEPMRDQAATGANGNNTGNATGGTVDVPPVIPPATNDGGNANNTNTGTGENNTLSGRSWIELLNGGGAATGPVLPPREADEATVRNNTLPPTRENITPPLEQATGPRRYIIKQGDSFWTIARAEYGNAAYFAHIVRANPEVDPGKLKPGMPIILPDKNNVVAAATAPRQPSAAEQVLDQATQYRVQTGDNLSVIAKKLYGRYDKWVSIYEMNKELIGSNPGVLKNGMILRLPEPPVRVAGSI
jgi:nucleoid-associated protein YgaU